MSRKDPEKDREYRRQWRKENREKILEYKRNWWRQNAPKKNPNYKYPKAHLMVG